jgi:hypothetical protein
MLTILCSLWKGSATEDDFWNEPSLSTYRFSVATMLAYGSQSLYERIDVNSTKDYTPVTSHKQKESIHVASAAKAA